MLDEKIGKLEVMSVTEKLTRKSEQCFCGVEHRLLGAGRNFPLCAKGFEGYLILSGTEGE